jgi:hypothetical protein
MKRDGLTESPADRWTRPEDYLGAMARKRGFRRSRRAKERTEPESPRLFLSTVPFVALMALLAVLTIGIVIVAFPGTQPPAPTQQVVQKEIGFAPRGWFQEAEKHFHR